MEFWLALFIFLFSHSAVARSGLRAWAIAKMGQRAYLLAYSLLSLALLAWVFVAAQAAPRTQLWPWLHVFYWLPNILMPLACVLLVCGFVVVNPLSIAPRVSGFDPARPSLTIALTRHPILWGFALWSTSHILPNGEYPLVVLFVVFAIFALAGLRIVDRKSQRELGSDKWRELSKNTKAMLLMSPALWSGRFQLTRHDIVGTALGLLLYYGLYQFHADWFGRHPAPPLPL